MGWWGYAKRQELHRRFFDVFGLWMPFPAPGTVTKRLRMKNRPQGSCPDILGPALWKHTTSGEKAARKDDDDEGSRPTFLPAPMFSGVARDSCSLTD